MPTKLGPSSVSAVTDPFVSGEQAEQTHRMERVNCFRHLLHQVCLLFLCFRVCIVYVIVLLDSNDKASRGPCLYNLA